MGEIVIKLEHIVKIYGEATVLDDVSLNFEKGRIYGLVGRNGSGKTMLMKVICGFVIPTKGKATVQGVEPAKKIPQSLGVIIEEPGFLPGYSAEQNLYFLSRIRGKVGKKEIREVLELVGLGHVGKKKVGKFSMGMRQRLGLAQVLMEDPDILILDEPMNGLDDKTVAEVRNILLKQKEAGKTIIIASHNAEDIAVLCDEVHHMEQGRLLD